MTAHYIGLMVAEIASRNSSADCFDRLQCEELKVGIIFFIYFFYFYLFILKGRCILMKHVNVNMPGLAKGYFPSAVPGRSEVMIQRQIQMKNTKKKSKNTLVELDN